MSPSSAFDAWRNFALVLAGVLAGDMLSSAWREGSFVMEVREAVQYLVDFDKTIRIDGPIISDPSLITVAVIIYYLKFIHGLIVGMFSVGFYSGIAGRPWLAMFSCTCVTVGIASLTFVPWFAAAASDQRTVLGTALGLWVVILLPTFALAVLDVLRVWERPIKINFRMIFRVYKSFDQVVATWILLDLLSLIVVIFWTVSVLSVVNTNIGVIYYSLWAFLVVLLLNSIVDYVLNAHFFFGFSPLRAIQADDRASDVGRKRFRSSIN